MVGSGHKCRMQNAQYFWAILEHEAGRPLELHEKGQGQSGWWQDLLVCLSLDSPPFPYATLHHRDTCHRRSFCHIWLRWTCPSFCVSQPACGRLSADHPSPSGPWSSISISVPAKSSALIIAAPRSDRTALQPTAAVKQTRSPAPHAAYGVINPHRCRPSALGRSRAPLHTLTEPPRPIRCAAQVPAPGQRLP
jgi:hypothetical protein